MMMLNELYTIVDSDPIDNGIKYTLSLNSESVIYKSHFPGQPITPGVCIIQIANELLEVFLQKKLQITKLNNVKFLSVIVPTEASNVVYTLSCIENIENTSIKLKVLVSRENINYAKISMICKIYE